MRRDTRNWITLGISLGLFAVALALLGVLLQGPREDPSDLDRPSSYFTDPTGARALFLVMQELLPSVRQWRSPLISLPPPDESSTPATLLVAEPRYPLASHEATHLSSWIAQGGQLILVTSDGWPLRESDLSHALMPEKALSEESDAQTVSQADTFLDLYEVAISLKSHEDEAPLQQKDVTLRQRGGPESLTFHLRNEPEWEGDFNVLAEVDGNPIAVEIRHGDGRIVAIGTPEIVTNQALRSSDNAIFLVRLCADWENGGVIIDEYHHGFRQSHSTVTLCLLFLQTPWGWATAQLLAAGALFLFGPARRIGRPLNPATPSRQSPMDLVGARAGFFQYARATRIAAHAIIDAFALRHPGTVRASRPSPGSHKTRLLHHPGAEQLAQKERHELQRIAQRLDQDLPLTENDLLTLAKITGKMSQESHGRS